MTNSDKTSPAVFGIFLLAFGIIVCMAGLPFVIAGSLFDNSTQVFWKIASLIMGSLFVLGVSISGIIFGITYIIEASYPDKEYLRIYIAVLSLLNFMIGFICFHFLSWITLGEEQSFAHNVFWVTSIITFVSCLTYSYKKIRSRIQDVSKLTQNIEQYLENLFNEIDNKKITYGAAFTKIEKEIAEKHFRVQCTNKIIFAYHKLTKEEKEYDYKSFLGDKNTLSNFYPLKSGRKNDQ